jgi:hypothetical protein
LNPSLATTDDMDARAKLKAETGLTENKIILSWLLNFRVMTIALPENKFIAYSRAISDMLERGYGHRKPNSKRTSDDGST